MIRKTQKKRAIKNWYWRKVRLFGVMSPQLFTPNFIRYLIVKALIEAGFDVICESHWWRHLRTWQRWKSWQANLDGLSE